MGGVADCDWLMLKYVLNRRFIVY